MTAVLVTGLPDISGKIYNTESVGAFFCSGSVESDGAFSVTTPSNSTGASGSNTGVNIAFSASRCSAIYGASDTVQPPALSLLPQIKF